MATVRDTTALYLSKLARTKVLIVIAGTGLDQIQYNKRVGTNPAYSRLVIMKSPNIKRLLENEVVSEEVAHAIDAGTFSSVLKTNSRMLFRSIIPILNLRFHEEDGFSGEIAKRRRRYEDRLVEVASIRCLMDHGPRHYINQNSVGNLGGAKRDELLCQAFLYHLGDAVQRRAKTPISKGVKNKTLEELNRIHAMKNFAGIEKQGQENIFSIGLVSEEGTSNALKFLACFGLSCEIRPAFGVEFEELTALHFMRYMQVQGYETKRITLKNAWPPAMKDTAELLRVLNTQKGEEEFELEKDVKKICYVFSQGTPTAQGGDVLALLIHADGLSELIAIQCKHVAESPGQQGVRKWWNSLGIQLDEGQDANWNLNEGSAHHPLLGLSSFRDLLAEKLGVASSDVEIGDRIIAASFSTPSAASDFPVPSDPRARVWFREMLEPTISIFSLKEPQ